MEKQMNANNEAEECLLFLPASGLQRARAMVESWDKVSVWACAAWGQWQWSPPRVIAFAGAFLFIKHCSPGKPTPPPFSCWGIEPIALVSAWEAKGSCFPLAQPSLGCCRMRTATAWQAVGGRTKCGFAVKSLSKPLWRTHGLVKRTPVVLQVFVTIPSAVTPSLGQQVLIFPLFRSLL